MHSNEENGGDARQELVNLVAVDETTMNRPSVDQVRAVISALYNDSDPSGKEKASEWLQELQRSVSTCIKLVIKPCSPRPAFYVRKLCMDFIKVLLP